MIISITKDDGTAEVIDSQSLLVIYDDPQPDGPATRVVAEAKAGDIRRFCCTLLLMLKTHNEPAYRQFVAALHEGRPLGYKIGPD